MEWQNYQGRAFRVRGPPRTGGHVPARVHVYGAAAETRTVRLRCGHRTMSDHTPNYRMVRAAMSERRVDRQDVRSDPPSDAQLMDRARLGDVRAFEQLVQTHWEGLVAYARRMTGDADVAQDAVQETLARFWQARGEWRQRGSVRGYLYRAVRNRIIDLARQRQARDRWSLRFRHELFLRPRTPDEILDDMQLRAALDRAIRSLPDRRREVFVLAHLQDLSYQEIAAVMDLAPQTVANHMSLALRDLRRSLGSTFPLFAGSSAAGQQRDRADRQRHPDC